MKVYVLETGCYEDRSAFGVYATPEAAMAAWQPKPEVSTYIQPPSRTIDVTTGRVTKNPGGPVAGRFTYTWSSNGHGWRFDADFMDAAYITEYEVEA